MNFETAEGFASEFSSRDFVGLSEQKQFHAYIRECEKHLGKVPVIDCNVGVEIPVGEFKNGSFFHVGKNARPYTGGWNELRTCDRPSFLLSAINGSGSCAPYSRAGRLPAAEGFNTDWVFVCRRYFDREPNSTRFDDVNLIGYNKETGATCFINSKVNETVPNSLQEDEGVDVANVPDPLADESLSFYQSLKKNASEARCVACHSAHPWLRTPYIQQVKWQGQPVVPPAHSKDPYFLVAYNYMEAVHAEPWQPKVLQANEAKACAACHRIGGDVYASYLAPASVGITEGLLGQEGEQVAPKYSQSRRTHPFGNIHFDFERNLLPNGTQEQWDKSRFKVAAEYIKSCGRGEKKQGECVWKIGQIKD